MVQETISRAGKNGGKLRSGNPGNRGGAGRVAVEARQRMAAESFASAILFLEMAALDPRGSERRRRIAIDLLARYGFGPNAKDAPVARVAEAVESRRRRLSEVGK